MGGETRPEVQSTIFEPGYEPGSTKYKQDFMQCVETTHATYILHSDAFENGGYRGAELQNALNAHARMGYNFEVTNVAVASSLADTVTVDVTLNQTGVAPFYYPLNLTLSCSGTAMSLSGVEGLVERGQSKVFSFSNIPASFVCLGQVTFTLVSSHTYTGRPIKFAQGDGKVSLNLPLPNPVAPIQIPVSTPVSLPAPTPVAAPTSYQSARLTLIDAITDREMGPFFNGTEIDLFKNPSVNIRADPDPSFLTGSVVFDYDGKLFRIENDSPYALYGNTGSDYISWTPDIGRHTVVATPYSGKDGLGIKGVPVLVTFTVTRSAPVVTQILLINADTDKAMQPLVNGTVLTLSALPTRRLNVQAITVPYPTGSVRFAYDTSAKYRVDNIIPYAIGGDSGGNFKSWTPSIGRHTITAFPNTGKDGKGTTGNPMTITFTVI